MGLSDGVCQKGRENQPDCHQLPVSLFHRENRRVHLHIYGREKSEWEKTFRAKSHVFIRLTPTANCWVKVWAEVKIRAAFYGHNIVL